MKKISAVVLLFLFVLAGFASASVEESDPHSFANFKDVRTSHLDLALKINFQTKTIEGEVTHTLKKEKKDISEFIVDTSFLQILAVTDSAGKDLKYEMTTPHAVYGSALKIKLTPEIEKIKIKYKTTPESGGLQWLDPALSVGKEKPLLFTMSQPIQGRSWLPVQDTPAVRATYKARVEVDKNLKVVALMSKNEGKPVELNSTGVYEFTMSRPIPSYLIALVVGDYKFKKLGNSNRVGIYAEPKVLDSAAKEFEETPIDVAKAEEKLGSYSKLWGRYDMVLLPPSFPYGGMENPGLVYIAPTVIAGDKSLVGVVSHELAHSWSGNLVTNANWQHMFLNEGLTRYFENIIQKLAGRKRLAEVDEALSYNELMKFTAEKNNGPETILVPNLVEKDPEEFEYTVYYEKGLMFFQNLERVLGQKKLISFLNFYLKKHSFQSVTTSDFVADLKSEVIKGNADLEKKLNLNGWLYEKGVPIDHPIADMTSLLAVKTELDKLKTSSPLDHEKLKKMISKEKEYFLENMPTEGVSITKLKELDTLWNLSQGGNKVIAASWFKAAIRNNYIEPLRPHILHFLTHVGRRYLVRYVVEYLAPKPGGKRIISDALAITKEGKGDTIQYHPATLRMVERFLEENPAALSTL